MTQLNYKNIETGIIPQELDSITNHILYIEDLTLKGRALLATLIVQARRNYFENDVTGWIYWCKEQGVADADIHPLRQAGDLLLDILPHDLKLYERLFLLDTEKTRAIGRLKAQVAAKLTLIDIVQKFLKAYPPEKLNRDEVRRCVAFVLGEVDSPELPEESQKAKSDKYQPTLWDGVGIILEQDDHDFEVMAMSENFNDESAFKFALSGLGLLTASKSYWKTHSIDSAKLAAVEKQLRDDADALAEIRNNQAAQLQAG